MKSNMGWEGIGVVVAIIIAIASAAFSLGTVQGKFSAMKNDLHELKDIVKGLQNVVAVIDKQAAQREIILTTIDKRLEKISEKLDGLLASGVGVQ